MPRHGCHDTARAIARPLLVQDGWRVIRRADGTITREPVMREHSTQWQPVRCGYLERATDDACGDCRHRFAPMRSDDK